MESIEETWARIAAEYPYRVRRPTSGAPSTAEVYSWHGRRNVFVLYEGGTRLYAFTRAAAADAFLATHGGERCDA